MAKKRKKYVKKKTIPFNFGQKHIEYIRKCVDNTYNFAEGAIRAGKTVDNVYAFAHEIETTPDKIHLATGSTAANAKLNIGDANGFGLEWIFRGQCSWGKYKGNECLKIKGPKTGNKERIVIFAGAAKQDSFKKIRGNSYGMWIATEINLHHDNTIKEAFNRTAAAKRRKFFWDLNPDHPKAPIYVDYIDKYREKARKGEMYGGVNYEHFTINDNINIPKINREEIISQYDESSIWYKRDILGIRCVADGLIFPKLASEIASERIEDKRHFISVQNIVALNKANSEKHKLMAIYIGVDFGGTSSGQAFVATGITEGYKEVIALMSERHIEDNESIDPLELGRLFVNFVRKVLNFFGYVTCIYPDTAESVLIRGLKRSMADAELGNIPFKNAKKIEINDRIFALDLLSAQERFFYTDYCDSLTEAISSCVWNPKEIKKVRLDDGTSDIDSMDAFEYTYERLIRKLLPTFKLTNRDEE